MIEINKNELHDLLFEVLERYRAKRKLSYEGLSLKAGLDRTFYYKLKLGRTPTLINIIKVSQALGVKSSVIIKEVEKQINQ